MITDVDIVDDNKMVNDIEEYVSELERRQKKNGNNNFCPLITWNNKARKVFTFFELLFHIFSVYDFW
jgi:hypothetical protein